jgi:ribosomal-protein-alanine N-acetyltransferase
MTVEHRPTAVTLRPMQRADLDAVLVLEAELFGDEAWPASAFESELGAADTRHYVVAVDDDDVVGYAGLCAYAHDQAFIQTIGVAGAVQRRGIGHRLLHALLDEAGRRGCLQLDLEVRDGNDAAIALYQQHGFRRISVRRRYYQPSGTDAIVMRRDRPGDA